MPLFGLLKGLCQRICWPFARKVIQTEEPKIVVLPPPEIPKVHHIYGTSKPIEAKISEVKAPQSAPCETPKPPKVPQSVKASKATAIVLFKEKRRVSYGKAFWMHHYRSIMRMFPSFRRDYKNKILSNAIPKYLKSLEERGEFCPSITGFRMQMRAILMTGQPMCGRGGRRKILKKVPEKLPKHFEIMKSLKGLSVRKATNRYNLAIQKHRKGKTAVKVSTSTFRMWRKTLNSQRHRIDEKVDEITKSFNLPATLVHRMAKKRTLKYALLKNRGKKHGNKGWRKSKTDKKPKRKFPVSKPLLCLPVARNLQETSLNETQKYAEEVNWQMKKLRWGLPQKR